MKNIVITTCTMVAAIFIAATTTDAAEGTNSGWNSTATFQSAIGSKYLAFGSGTVLYDRPVIHSDLKIRFENGLYIDLWGSQPANDQWNANFGTEIDLGLGWEGPLSRIGVSGKLSDIQVSIGTSYFDEPDLSLLGAGDTLYSHLTLSKNITSLPIPLSVNAEFENYVTMPGTAVNGGNLYSIGASTCLSPFKDRLNGKLVAISSLSLVYDDGGYAMDSGLLLRGFVELDWNVSKRLTTFVQGLYYAPLTVKDSRELDAMVFVGFRIKCW